MKQIKIIRAYKALNNIYDQKASLAVSHKLWTLRKKLAPQWEFQSEKEQEIIMKYNPEIKLDGSIMFKSKEDEQACMREYSQMISELADIDVDIGELKKIELHSDNKLEMSIEDMDALSDFIEFIE